MRQMPDPLSLYALARSRVADSDRIVVFDGCPIKPLDCPPNDVASCVHTDSKVSSYARIHEGHQAQHSQQTSK